MCHKHNANPFVCNFIHLLLADVDVVLAENAALNLMALLYVIANNESLIRFELGRAYCPFLFNRVFISFTTMCAFLDRPEKWGPI